MVYDVPTLLIKKKYMNIINTAKISKITALSAAVIVFGAIALAATPAFAYGGGYNHGGNSYYNSYYPTNTNSSSASAASASSNSTSNTNTNTNVNVNVNVNGGGYVAQPVYSEPVVYNYPETSYVPTYYNDYTAPPTYEYTEPTYAQTSYEYPTTYPSTYGNTGYYNNTSLEATCSVNTSSASVGQPVTWSANVTGGSGYYTYSWSGSNNLYGSGSSINATYNTNGQQTAEVTVTSNSGQSVTAQCTNTVTIGGGSNAGNGNELTIGCAADVATTREGTPVTWSVEAIGGSGTYTYTWSGTDGLTGSQSSVATAYESAGQKQAEVIVTSSNGFTGSKSCTPITVLGAGGGNGSGSTNVTPPTTTTNNSGLSAASLFSLANIPWGWVAVLVILVLFGTIMYLLFNKSKI